MPNLLFINDSLLSLNVLIHKAFLLQQDVVRENLEILIVKVYQLDDLGLGVVLIVLFGEKLSYLVKHKIVFEITSYQRCSVKDYVINDF